jgi:nitroreductase
MSTTTHDIEEIKRAESDAPLIPEVSERWSPRRFSDQPVSAAELRTLLEAARWAPSSYNEQPWHFLLARREDDESFARMLDCLVEANMEWARGAPVLMLTVASTHFERNGKENRHARHDIGLAMGHLVVQATAMDIFVHQMAGIRPDRAREIYGIPEGYEVVAGAALGRLGDVDVGGLEARSRKPLSDFVFQDEWGQAAEFVTGVPATR